MKRLHHTIGLASIFLLVCSVLWMLLPLPTALREPQLPEPVRILDRHGELLYEWRSDDRERRRAIALADVPSSTVEALIASEDRTFRTHPGVSARGILRALVTNLRAGEIRSGGSTLTQQLVRIHIAPASRGFLWKIREALLALKLETRWSKEEILTAYVNTAPFGRQAAGIAAAADAYFGKSPQELSIAEGAFIIGLLRSPSALEPTVNFAGAKVRQQQVLAAMEETGVLGAEDARAASAEAIRLAPRRTAISAPHFVFWVLASREELLPGQRAVRTTLDLELQTGVERIVERELLKLAEENVTSAAVVVLDARSGDVLAMVGSRDYFDAAHDGAVNVAVSARQPGSALKPFTYALALEAGDSAATTVADVEEQFATAQGNPYIPRNYDFTEHGLVRYREALGNSYNIAAVKVLERVGAARLLSLLRATGITTLALPPEHYGLALTLGAGEVRLLELARAYGVFARGGRSLTERALLLEESEPGAAILSEETAWIVADILRDPQARLEQFGEGSPLDFDFPVAAKTGTTRNSRDNWTIGFTPERIVGVWVGNADNTPMRGTSGVTGAGPIFHAAMEEAMQRLPKTDFERPPGIVEMDICRLSGKLPTPHCPQTIREVFAPGTEPLESDDVYSSVAVDVRTGLRAGRSCEAAFVAEHTFTTFPLELRAWAREQGFQEPPQAFSPLCPEDGLGEAEAPAIAITRPRAGESLLLDPLIPNTAERLILEARASMGIEEVSWFLDGALLGRGQLPNFRLEWIPTPGLHRIEAHAGELRDSVSVEILQP